ncbi:rRNA methyltransferase 2, mitochondrial [Aphidius gifuensis]|uniref:rRNA methyltransferase 2, mitochondrial n=1 Tax=Aphidius gifuensis TaxID=684658 RepID=UPI001CDCEE67|nr:rRNA methyltransferase 2, mitochondrial [Aphidius gifuensis]XP_044006369.1 rRNA methyltransferase 2, mitochondrial [Aphidius gifuensis]
MEAFVKLIQKRCIHTCKVNLSNKMPSNLKGKSASSQRWLTRQLQDPYVEKARQENYRCRSAFKLIEINDRFQIFKPGQIVVDCGAAPGSWTQVAVKKTNSDGKINNELIGKVFAIDRLPIHHIDGATILGNHDFTKKTSQKELAKLLDGSLVDVVLSDMAPNATGVRSMDHELIINLAYAALKFAIQVSTINATLIVKLWDGGEAQQFEKDTAKFYKTIKIVRPGATRDESTEKFILARGFNGIQR